MSLESGSMQEFDNSEGLKPGMVYIIDNRINSPLVPRKENCKDVIQLQTIFEKFGMKVTCVINGALDNITAEMEKLSRYDFRKLSCLVMVIITPTFRNSKLPARWGEYSFETVIMRSILQNKSLKTKPKLFFVQSFYGDITFAKAWQMQIIDEVFLMYFCNQGDLGNYFKDFTIFTRALCDQLEKYGKDKCITYIGTKVVEKAIKLAKELRCKRRLPVIHTTTLSNQLVFGNYIKNMENDSDFCSLSDGNSSSECEIVEYEDIEPGRTYIINHRTFNDPKLKQRDGSEVDVELLKNIFREFDMEVTCIDDGTLDDIKTLTDEVSEYNFRKSSCLVMVIMSYCGSLDKISAKDGNYSLKLNIIPSILQNESLKSKPKIIFMESSDCLREHFIRIEGPLTEEIFAVKSCVSGFMTYQNKEKGSIFINTLCKHMTLSGRKKCIEEVIEDTVNHMQMSRYHITIKHTKLQRFSFGDYIKDRNIKSFNTVGVQPGRAYIINHRTFNDTNFKERIGSKHDLKRLQKVFKRFCMKTEILEDGTKADVRAVMDKVSEYDFKNLSCVVVVIMSHGTEGDIILAKDGTYSLNQGIMYPLLQNNSLRSKPKFIFVQACKGPVDPFIDIDAPRSRPTEIPDEILQLNSCVEGFVSYLNRDKGSIFIRKLCQHLERYGMEKSIVEIARGIVEHVKTNFSDMQIPMLHTNLTKRFVFGDYIRNRRIVKRNPVLHHSR